MSHRVRIFITPNDGEPGYSLGLQPVGGGVLSGAFTTPDKARARRFDMAVQADVWEYDEVQRIARSCGATVRVETMKWSGSTKETDR